MKIETIGNATLYLGDCLEVLPTLAKVDAVITDPPYGVAHKAEAVMGASWSEVEIEGDGSTATRDAALDSFVCPLAAFGGWRRPALTRAHTCLIWDKGHVGGMNFHAPWRQNWEAVFLRGPWPKDGMESGILRGHFIPTWEMQGRQHPHQKPVSLLELLTKKSGGETILDPFMGSGTTGVACANLGRPFIGIEIDPKFFEVACERIENAQRQERLFA